MINSTIIKDGVNLGLESLKNLGRIQECFPGFSERPVRMLLGERLNMFTMFSLIYSRLTRICEKNLCYFFPPL